MGRPLMIPGCTQGRDLAGPDEIMESVNLLWRTWAVMLAGCLIAALLF